MATRKPRLVVNEAKTFDFDAFIADIRVPEFTRNLYKRADLLPRIAQLDERITDTEKRIETAEKAQGEQERSVTDVDVVSELTQRLDKMVAEFNSLYEEYEASAIPFVFRVPNHKDDAAAVKASLVAAGHPEELPKEADEDEQMTWWETYVMHSMAHTCTSHPMSVEQWYQLREHVGEVAFAPLGEAWSEAVKAVNPPAPFSQRPSPTEGENT